MSPHHRPLHIALLFFLTLWLALTSYTTQAQETDLLPPDQAFRFTARALDEQTVEVHFDIAPGYYLYQSRFQFSTEPDATPGTPTYPKGEPHEDAWFGKQTIYRQTLTFTLPVTAALSHSFTLTVTAQGCADLGVCYPPTPFKADLSLAAMSVPETASNETDWKSKFGTTSSATSVATQMDTPASASATIPASRNEPDTIANTSTPPENDSQIADLLQHGNLFWVLAFFYLSGLGLSFTPCVLPMVPILSGIIVGHGHNISRLRAFTLSLAYVLGMAFTYTLAGVAAALIGEGLAAWFQNIWVLGGFALMFVILALSMFGVFELQLPSALQSRLADSANKQGGSLIGLAIMGALSALIVGPCVAAPLAGALLYIAKTGNAILGGSALFVMALGMGTLLLGVGIGAHLLPKTGAWMKSVNRIFGVLLLATAIWLISPVIPAIIPMFAWGALLAISGIFLRAIDPLPPHAHGWQRLFKGIGVILLLTGATLILGGLAGSRDPLQPLAGLYARSGSVTTTHISFERIKSVQELDARLKTAGKPVMLDFYADWCVSCKEMERYTFNDDAIRSRLNNFIILQADVTANDDADRALLKRFGLFGPPGIIFFNTRGEEMKNSRVIGFMNTSRFGETLDTIQQQGK